MRDRSDTRGGLGAAWLLSLLCLAWPTVASAHKPSDSFLTLRLEEQSLHGEWDIALRDLEHALGLDLDQDGQITWGELESRHAAIADYALARLLVSSGETDCTLRRGEQLVDRHSDGVYSVLRFVAECPSRGELSLDYRLFFDLDPSHRGLLRVDTPQSVRTAVLSPQSARFDLVHQQPGAWRELVEYWREGVWHIWIGFDHILFLLTLLLGAVLCREGRSWRPVESFRPALLQVAGIVTAFTVAHSVTLALAVLGWINLPARWVESAIAATVVLAAINNLYPVLPGKRWMIAFALGLIHGFGFAGVLAELGLPGGALVMALVGFNLGVETGQLAIVLLFLPIAFLLRESWFYRRVVFATGSVLVALIAAAWFVERSLDLRLLPM
ncbi:MAG: HupE/UreJ family protein [Acidobacteriota bacterium]